MELMISVSDNFLFSPLGIEPPFSSPLSILIIDLIASLMVKN